LDAHNGVVGIVHKGGPDEGRQLGIAMDVIRTWAAECFTALACKFIGRRSAITDRALTLNRMSKFVLPLSDFNRIHQVAHGVLKEIGDIKIACVWFNVFGAYILEHKYGITARPVAGGFSLRVAEGRNLIYGREEGDEWIEAPRVSRRHFQLSHATISRVSLAA
jgi:hypothetical protein